MLTITINGGKWRVASHDGKIAVDLSVDRDNGVLWISPWTSPIFDALADLQRTDPRPQGRRRGRIECPEDPLAKDR